MPGSSCTIRPDSVRPLRAQTVSLSPVMVSMCLVSVLVPFCRSCPVPNPYLCHGLSSCEHTRPCKVLSHFDISLVALSERLYWPPMIVLDFKELQSQQLVSLIRHRPSFAGLSALGCSLFGSASATAARTTAKPHPICENTIAHGRR